MTMFKALVANRMRGAFAALFTIGQAGKKRGPFIKALIALLALVVVANFGVLAGMLFYSLYPAFFQAGLLWFYFALAGLAAFVLSFVSGIFLAQPLLFDAGDNETLLAMPIPPRMILFSRLTVLMVFTFFTQLFILLPAAVVWFMFGPVSALGLVLYVLASLMLLFLSLALCCLGGWLVALVSARISRKSLAVTLLSVAFLAAYFYVFSQIQQILGRLIQNGAEIAQAVQRTLFPAYHFGRAIAQTSWMSLLWFALSAAVPFLFVTALISRSIMRILTTRRGSVRREYTGAPIKTRSAQGALLKKELGRFFASPVYMMNAGLGLLFLLALPIVLLIKPDILYSVLANFPLRREMVGAAAVAVLSIMNAMIMISASSVSLEGKNLWIIKSLPVNSGNVLLIKAAAHLTLSAPVNIVSGILMILVLNTSLPVSLMLLLLPLLFSVFNALLGVAVNVRFPKLDWNNETEAVKQGISSILALLGGVVAVAAPVLLYVFALADLMGPVPVMAVYALLLAGACLLLYRYLVSRGGEAFSNIAA